MEFIYEFGSFRSRIVNRLIWKLFCESCIFGESTRYGKFSTAFRAIEFAVSNLFARRCRNVYVKMANFAEQAYMIENVV